MKPAIIPILLVSLITLVAGKETKLELVVKGLESAQTSQRVTTTIATLAGAHLVTLSQKPGLLSLRFDPAKLKEADLKKKLTAAGVKITAHRTTFKIKGLVCQNCSNHLTHLLGHTPGVTFVESISYLTGTATLTFDPLKTDETKIKAAIHTTQYKVMEAKKAVSPVKE